MASGRYPTSPAAPFAPAIDLAVDHDAHADPRAHVQIHEVLDVAPEAESALAERAEVHIVLEEHVRPKLRADRVEQPGPAPSGQVVGKRRVIFVLGEHARAPDARDGDVAPPQPRVLRHIPSDPAQLGDQDLRARQPGGLVGPGGDRAGEVGHRRAHALAADVDPDHVPRRGVQLVQHRGRSLAAGGAARLPDEAGLLEHGQSACETVGFETPEARAICARDAGPIWRMHSRTVRSLMARSKLGVPAAKVC